jgi:hypothetical protein
MPWFWGINGAAGVLAAILAVATSIAFGIQVTLTIGALCYLLLVPTVLLAGMVGRTSHGTAGARASGYTAAGNHRVMPGSLERGQPSAD